jgi:anti-sigma-K factor RskA
VNIHEYISSGIVESYVLGLADREEAAEFEHMCASYNEVKIAREAFEILVEEYSIRHSVRPGAIIKSKIFSEIEIESENTKSSIADKKKYFADKLKEAPENKNDFTKITWQRYLKGVTVILLLGSIALNFYFFNQYSDFSSRYNNLLYRHSQITNNNNSLVSRLDHYQNIITMLNDPEMTVIKLTGKKVLQGSPEPRSVVTLYWDTRSKNIFISINNLPRLTEGKQYQLWAIVNGKPVDAGVFEIPDAEAIIKLKNIPQAQAFAVTLENKGGSSTPQGPMFVFGTV